MSDGIGDSIWVGVSTSRQHDDVDDEVIQHRTSRVESLCMDCKSPQFSVSPKMTKFRRVGT